MRVSTNSAVEIKPAEREQRTRARVERVEQRLLVFLEIAVVRERETLERREETGEMADQAARLAARELGDVGVLLLRQHRRTGGVRVGEPEEAELLGRPQHDLLAEPREVHLGERRDEQRLGDEVTVGDRVERVVERGREAELVGDELRIERQARTRERARAERRHVGALEAVAPAIEIAAQRPEVREQMMREQHRLRALEVRVAGEVHVGGFLGPPHEHLLQLVDAPHLRETFAAQVQPHVERDLIVAAAAGVQLRAGRARDLGDAALDRGVDVFVGRRERERSRRQLLFDARERGVDHLALLLVEQADPLEHVHVRARPDRDRRARAGGRTAG